MKAGLFTNTNDKGQIVIPKEVRDALGINPSITLSLMMSGNGLYIYPVAEFITKADKESSYSQLLELTKGSWGNEEKSQVDTERSSVELEASARRKKSW